MFGAKSRRIAELTARVSQLAEQRDTATTDAEDHKGAATMSARLFLHAADETHLLRDRLGVMLLITRRQRVTIRKQALTITRLQDRIDNAPGLIFPSTEAGAL